MMHDTEIQKARLDYKAHIAECRRRIDDALAIIARYLVETRATLERMAEQKDKP